MRFYIFIFCLLNSVALQAELDPELVASQILHFENNPSDVPNEIDVSQHKRTKFVFVKGLAGEYIPLYFHNAIKELETLTQSRGEKDPSKKRVFRITGDSRKGLEENATHVQSKLSEIIRTSEPGTKLVVIGHSKGAVELWTAVMQNPLFAENHIAGSVFIQGPFQGSPLADFIVKGKSVGDVEPFRENPLMYGLRAMFLTPYKSKLVRPGIEAITTSTASEHTSATQKEFGKQHQSENLGKTLFLATHQPELSGLGRFIPPINFVMDVCVRSLSKITNGAPNDGLVPLSAQVPKGVEARTQVLPFHHHADPQATAFGKYLARALFSITP